jgi:hypothetical protein
MYTSTTPFCGHDEPWIYPRNHTKYNRSLIKAGVDGKPGSSIAANAYKSVGSIGVAVNPKGRKEWWLPRKWAELRGEKSNQVVPLEK